MITKEKGKELTEEIMKGIEEEKQESEEKKGDYRNSWSLILSFINIEWKLLKKGKNCPKYSLKGKYLSEKIRYLTSLIHVLDIIKV